MDIFQKQLGDSPEGEQMERVKPVEKALQPDAALSVVEPYKRKGKHGEYLPEYGDSSPDDLLQPVIPECIEDYDQKDSFVVIICL